MVKSKNKKMPTIVTTRDLGEIILKKNVVPTPIYTSGRETSHIVNPRGTIFSKAKRRKSPKF